MPRKRLRPPREVRRAERLLAYIAALLVQARSGNPDARALARAEMRALPYATRSQKDRRAISRSVKWTAERIQVQRMAHEASAPLKAAKRYFAPFYEVQDTVEKEDIKEYAAEKPEFVTTMKALDLPMTDASIREIVRTGTRALVAQRLQMIMGLKERALKARLYPRLLRHDGSLIPLSEFLRKIGTGQEPKSKKLPKT